MGLLHGVAVAGDFIRPGDTAQWERLERCRIAIAARSIPCEPPQFWPQRGRS